MKTKQQQKKAIKFLLDMIYYGFKENDKDCLKSHLEQLNDYVIQENLINDE